MSFETPPPDLTKLLAAWEEWELGEEAPGKVLTRLKTAGLPAVLAELRDASAQVLRDPEYLARLRAAGSLPFAMSAADFGALIARYGDGVRDLVRRLAIVPS